MSLVTKRTQAAVAFIFFLNGAVFGNWVPRIPSIQQQLGLNDAELGVALLGMAAGALMAMPCASLIVEWLGSRHATTWFAIFYCLAIALPPAAPSLTALALGLFAVGTTSAILDVSMNAQGIAVEGHRNRPMLTYFHAAFSIGSLAGAGASSISAAAGVAALPHLFGTGIVFSVLAIAISPALLPSDTSRRVQRRWSLTRPTRPLLLLGLAGFCALLAEGSVADWSAVYLQGSLGASPGLAGAGYVAFASTMVLGRLSGARLTRILGPVIVVQISSVLAMVGVALVVLPGSVSFAILGFACLGAGLSCVFPLVLSATVHVRRIPIGAGIATVSVMGYCGFLIGPPMIGFISEAFSLRGGFGLVGVLGLVILILSRVVRPAAGNENDYPYDEDESSKEKRLWYP